MRRTVSTRSGAVDGDFFGKSAARRGSNAVCAADRSRTRAEMHNAAGHKRRGLAGGIKREAKFGEAESRRGGAGARDEHRLGAGGSCRGTTDVSAWRRESGAELGRRWTLVLRRPR